MRWPLDGSGKAEFQFKCFRQIGLSTSCLDLASRPPIAGNRRFVRSRNLPSATQSPLHCAEARPRKKHLAMTMAPQFSAGITPGLISFFQWRPSDRRQVEIRSISAAALESLISSVARMCPTERRSAAFTCVAI